MDNKTAARSVNRKISALKTYYRFCRQQKAITHDPMAKVAAPKTPKNLPLFVERSGMDNLFHLVEASYPEASETQRFVKHRDRMIVEMLYATGMRRGELLGLSDMSFDVANEQVKVLGKGNKERIIPVSKDLLALVKIYQAERNRLFGKGQDFLVTGTGKPAYPKMVYNIVHKVLQQVTTLTRTSPHVLRHTFATHLSNNGAELNAVKELLGHASLASTQVYTHNTIDQLKKIHKRAHPKG
jgi:integrase/recombinase XerC